MAEMERAPLGAGKQADGRTMTIYVGHTLSCNCNRCRQAIKDGTKRMIRYHIELLSKLDLNKFTDKELQEMEEQISNVSNEWTFFRTGGN